MQAQVEKKSSHRGYFRRLETEHSIRTHNHKGHASKNQRGQARSSVIRGDTDCQNSKHTQRSACSASASAALQYRRSGKICNVRKGPNQWKGKERNNHLKFQGDSFHNTVISRPIRHHFGSRGSCPLHAPVNPPKSAAVTSRRFFSIHLPVA